MVVEAKAPEEPDAEIFGGAFKDLDALKNRLVRWFDDSEQASQGTRERAERDQDYYDGKQLTDAEMRTLKERGQPPISINLVRRKVDFLRGMEVRQRSDPKAWPRTPADVDTAEVATDTLRYVFDATKYNNTVRKWFWKDLLVIGWAGMQVTMKEQGRPDEIASRFGMEPNSKIVIQRTPWDRMFWDPRSSEHDFSDAVYRGLIIWKDKEDALAMYDHEEAAKEIIETSFEQSASSETFGDKPRNDWVDAAGKRVRIVQIWWKERNQVFWAEFTRTGILDGGVSPFTNEDDDPCDNFVWQSLYVDRDNSRCGIVRDMIDPQDEVNKRRSKSLHLLTVRQVIADEGAVQDTERARKELARPDGWLTKTPGLDLQIVQNGDLSAGQMSLLQHATAELEKMGPNEALQGQGRATSGRDRQAQQQGGLVELGPTMDDLVWADMRAYNIVWTMVQSFWTAPQFIRVTDRDDAPRFVGLNEPLIDPSGQVAGWRNQPSKLNVDIVIEPAPDIATIEQEVWSELSDKIPMLASMPPQWALVLVEAMPLPPSRKRKLQEMLNQLLESNQAPQQPEPDPLQQQMMQIGMAKEVATVEKTKADAAKAAAEARHKAAQTEKMGHDAQVEAAQIAMQARHNALRHLM